MGIQVIPTNIGGVSLNSIASPLASLLGGTPSAQNMVFPADLGTNPTLGHAVIFQAYDYKTKIGQALAQAAAATVGAAVTQTGIYNRVTSSLNALYQNSGPASAAFLNAGTYSPQKQQPAYATISLYMPDTQNISYTTHYEEVGLSKELGIPGYLGHAISDAGKEGFRNTGTPYATAALGAAVGAAVGSESVGKLATQGAGLIVNPQIQLLFTSVELRTFQLEFLMTPKNSSEAQTVKNICDAFAFFSLPGIAGAQQGQAGQFLTPPQVFSVQFQFLGNSGPLSQISNTLQSALNNTGLNTLIAGSGSPITGGVAAKTYSVNDCVLQDVNIDYAPNGWSAYNDGYPVQTRLTLQFKETTMITKNQFKDSSIAANYNQTQLNSVMLPAGSGLAANETVVVQK